MVYKSYLLAVILFIPSTLGSHHEHFTNVQLFSLPVGHTHDLVDQRFKP